MVGTSRRFEECLNNYYFVLPGCLEVNGADVSLGVGPTTSPDVIFSWGTGVYFFVSKPSHSLRFILPRKVIIVKLMHCILISYNVFNMSIAVASLLSSVHFSLDIVYLKYIYCFQST